MLSDLNVINHYLSLIENAATILNYDGYLNGAGSAYMEVKVNKGMGFYIFLLMNLSIIWYSKKINAFYHDRLITILYNLFLFGTCLGYITMLNQMITRLTLFVSSCNFVLYGLVLSLLIQYNNKKFFILLILPIILVLSTIINANSHVDRSAFFRLIFDYT